MTLLDQTNINDTTNGLDHNEHQHSENEDNITPETTSSATSETTQPANDAISNAASDQPAPTVDLKAVNVAAVTNHTEHSESHLASLVHRGFAKHMAIKRLQRELEIIENELRAEACARPDQHEGLRDARSTGSQWVAAGDGCHCRVVFPAPSLRRSLPNAGLVFEKARKLAGEAFDALFEPVRRIEPRTNFRTLVYEMLSKSAADRLVRLLSTAGHTRIVWSRQ